jgi:hypothetical protein
MNRPEKKEERKRPAAEMHGIIPPIRDTRGQGIAQKTRNPAHFQDGRAIDQGEKDSRVGKN